MNREIIFITGGVKSGKSSFALRCAGGRAGARAFIATATAGDADMEIKIARHKQERGSDWVTFEEPLEVWARIRDCGASYDCIVVDCLTIWVSNLITLYHLDDEAIRHHFSQLAESLFDVSARCVVVTNEVSMGLIPVDPLARRYQNLLGTVNGALAAKADTVYFMVAGIPWQIK